MVKVILSSLVLLGALAQAQAQEISDPLVKMLFEKGILSKDEAIRLEERVSGPGSTESAEKTAEEPRDKLAGKFTQLKIEGLDYLGYTYKDPAVENDTGDFEVRRGYFVTKAYFNDTDYLRMTLDVSEKDHKDSPDEGKEFDAKFKHLYLYLDISEYLPHTGFELGIAHTPWLDYEEHAGWLYRSISGTFFEAGDSAHLLPSADLGVNFKTKTDYVSAEYGIFNGEGYDHIGRTDKGDKGDFFANSLDGRVTWHVLGGGTKKPKLTEDTYANISLHALDSMNHRGSADDLKVYQIHAVYNTPMFLLAGQYIKSDWFSGSENEGDGYSLNGEVRPIKDWALIGRYDHWEPDDSQGTWDDRSLYIYGIAWSMSHNVRWILSAESSNYSGGSDPRSNEADKIMLTAEIHW